MDKGDKRNGIEKVWMFRYRGEGLLPRKVRKNCYADFVINGIDTGITGTVYFLKTVCDYITTDDLSVVI